MLAEKGMEPLRKCGELQKTATRRNRKPRTTVIFWPGIQRLLHQHLSLPGSPAFPGWLLLNRERRPLPIRGVAFACLCLLARAALTFGLVVVLSPHAGRPMRLLAPTNPSFPSPPVPVLQFNLQQRRHRILCYFPGSFPRSHREGQMVRGSSEVTLDTLANWEGGMDKGERGEGKR